MVPETISGSFVAMFSFDVSDEIRLEELRRILKVPVRGREPSFRQPAPIYVQFAKPPVIESLPPVDLAGFRPTGRVAYFDYGVMSLNLEIPFSGTWQEVVALVSHWMNDPALEHKA